MDYEGALRLLEELSINVASVQHRILCEILAQNSHTEYLCKIFPRLCADPPVIDPHSFKLFAPLSSYEDLLPFIDRIAAGDKSPILTAHPITELFQSSGTSSGKRKLLPSIESDVERKKLLHTFTRAILSRHLQDLDDGKEMYFIFMRPDEWTDSGVLMRPITSSYFKSPNMRRHLEEEHVSPMEVVLGCEDASQSAYSQLLCGLIRRKEVVCVGAVFASSLLHVLHVLQQRWSELVEDIRSGCLSKTAVTDPSVRKAVEALIHGPDPTLAMQVEAECSRDPLWKGIVSRIWPHAKYISCVTSGSMEQYISKLEFFAGGLPLISTLYGGSEGAFGINISPLCSPYEVSYTILPDMAYFEFLPLDASNDNNQSCLVDLVNVELGKEYEMVVTTFAGLYRFRVGDVLRVTGFYNKTPQFRLVGRKNVVLSVDIDKTDEATLEQAVQAARVGHLEEAGGLLVDYTSYTDASTFPGHYALFWEVTVCHSSGVGEAAHVGELPGGIPGARVFEECCLTMENCFDIVYKYVRQQKKIGPLEIRVVNEGTFHAFMNYHVARGASMSQFKTPRVIKFDPLIEFFNSKVSHSFRAHA